MTSDAPETPKAAPPPQMPPPLVTLDPRRNAYRPDLAATDLWGKVDATRFADGEKRVLARAVMPLRRAPDLALGIETEVLFGETLMVYDVQDGWAWVQAERDRYVGYIPADALAVAEHAATHRVRALGTFVYPAADIKRPALMHLSLNCRLAIVREDDKFSELATGGFVITRHIAPLADTERDFVDVAERFMGTPYLWGGRTRIGIDCSGLIQTALFASGIDCPRDSDMQASELGSKIAIPETLDTLERGDLIFWKGHVGVMADGVMLLHANAHHMTVVVETLPEAVERIAKTGSKITGIRRLPRLGTVRSASAA